MTDYAFPEGASCEVSKNVYHPMPKKRIPIPALETYSTPELHRDILNSKSKKEAIRSMRRYIANRGGWSDMPDGVWERLEEWCR